MLTIWAFYRLRLRVWHMKVSRGRNENERSNLQRNMQALKFLVILWARPEVFWWMWVAVWFGRCSALWLSAETPSVIARCGKLEWETGHTSSWMGVYPYLLLFASSWKFPIMSVIQHTGLLGHDMWTTKANAAQVCLLFNTKDCQDTCMTALQHLSDYVSDFWSCFTIAALSVNIPFSFFVCEGHVLDYIFIMILSL